jgi:hypothetical protein
VRRAGAAAFLAGADFLETVFLAAFALADGFFAGIYASDALIDFM